MSIRVLKIITQACFISLLMGCGSSSTDDPVGTNEDVNSQSATTETTDPTDPTDPTESTESTESSWTIDEVTFGNNGSTEGLQSVINGVVTTTIISTEFFTDDSNTAFDFSQITITAPDLGSGDYALVPSFSELENVQQNSPGSQAAYILISHRLNGIVRLRESTTGVLSVTVDEDTNYRYSIADPVIFNSDFPEMTQAQVTINNVFGIRIDIQ